MATTGLNVRAIPDNINLGGFSDTGKQVIGFFLKIVDRTTSQEFTPILFESVNNYYIRFNFCYSGGHYVLKVQVHGIGGYSSEVTIISDVLLNNWYWLEMIWEDANTQKFYVNGILKQTFTGKNVPIEQLTLRFHTGATMSVGQIRLDYILYMDGEAYPPPFPEDSLMPPCPPLNPYELNIGGNPVSYIKVHYVKNHPDPDPDVIDVTVLSNVGIKYFDPIELKKNGVTEFYGFVEEINPQKGIDGLEYLITGRDWKLILWRKQTEKFMETREIGVDEETGFFGNVYASELFMFLLRCPVSTHPYGKIRHMIGWGIPADSWVCSAKRTAYGHHPQWVSLRETGFSWQLGNKEFTNTTLKVNAYSVTENHWIKHGASPYLNDDDAINYIEADILGDYDGYYSFEDISTTDYVKGSVTACILHIKGRFVDDGGSGGGDTVNVRAYIYVNGSSVGNDTVVFTNGGGWENKTYDISALVDTFTKLNNLRVILEWSGSTDSSKQHPEVTYMYVVTSGEQEDTQTVGDWFKIDLGSEYDRVTAILIENREANYLLATTNSTTPAGGKDVWTESAAAVYWDVITGAIATVTDDAVIYQVGSNSIKIDSGGVVGAGEYSAALPQDESLNLDVTALVLPKINFRLRFTNVLWIRIRLGTGPISNYNYFEYEVTGGPDNVWKQWNIDISAYNTKVGSPIWTDIDYVQFLAYRPAFGTSTIWVDELYLGYSTGDWLLADYYFTAGNIEIHVSGDDFVTDDRTVYAKTSYAARDILASWKPEDNVRYIKVLITIASDVEWAISQIYVWQAEVLKYRLMNET